ncbi:Reverse_transcriptase/endonuclease [Hexamita inflata]|uniref:Reverse transcriptase/endonuclease n=1 Tax=Hexamita inflata TaxID=28002 RepID=A0AA86TME2_9EUKA|nr:Reverse transcriptase/endonuclease [Hexamita inflata]
MIYTFAGALTDVITAMEAKGYQLTVFADDIQISHDQNVDKDVVLQELAALLQPLGLELALNKCASTQDKVVDKVVKSPSWVKHSPKVQPSLSQSG